MIPAAQGIFENKVKLPMVALLETINSEFAKCAPDYITDPKKAVYRIYRDTRFSSDKSTYKTHLAVSFFQARRRPDAGAGFYFTCPRKASASRAVSSSLRLNNCWPSVRGSPKTTQRFGRPRGGPEKLMGKLHGETLLRIPKGFSADHPAADLIKRKRWMYFSTLDPEFITSPKLAAELMKRYRAMPPFVEILNGPLAAHPARVLAHGAGIAPMFVVASPVSQCRYVRRRGTARNTL